MGNQASLTKMYETPITRKFRPSILKNSTVLMGGAIVNPFGPTLTCVVIEEQPAAGEYNILQIMLNPFAQWVKEVGTFTRGETCTIADDFSPLYGLEWGSCPSFLLPPDLFSESFTEMIYRRFFQSLENGYALLEGVRKTPNDPFERIKVSMESFVQNGEQEQDRKLTPKDAAELALRLLDPEANKKEMQASFAAWDGAIRFQKDNRMKAMSLKKFLKIFAPLGLTCRLSK